MNIPENEILNKINQFNNQLENQIKETNEKLVQLGQDDQTSEKPF